MQTKQEVQPKVLEIKKLFQKEDRNNLSFKRQLHEGLMELYKLYDWQTLFFPRKKRVSTERIINILGECVYSYWYDPDNPSESKGLFVDYAAGHYKYIERCRGAQGMQIIENKDYIKESDNEAFHIKPDQQDAMDTAESDQQVAVDSTEPDQQDAMDTAESDQQDAMDLTEQELLLQDDENEEGGGIADEGSLFYETEPEDNETEVTDDKRKKNDEYVKFKESLKGFDRKIFELAYEKKLKDKEIFEELKGDLRMQDIFQKRNKIWKKLKDFEALLQFKGSLNDIDRKFFELVYEKKLEDEEIYRELEGCLQMEDIINRRDSIGKELKDYLSLLQDSNGVSD